MGEEVTIAQLRLLSTFATETSISGVARRLGLSQPTVSQTVKALERRLGRQLIERTPGGSVLTADGRMVVEWGQGLLREADRFLELIEMASPDRSGRLRIAASMTIAEYLVPYWLVTMAKHGVDADEVELRVANSEDVMSMVHSRRVDAGFIEGLHLRAGLSAMPIGEDRLVVVVSAEHPWAAAGHISLGGFLGGPLLVRESGSGTREVLEEALRSLGESIPKNVATLGSTSSIKTAVRAGDGAGIVSALAVRDELAGGSLCEVRVAGLEMRRALRMVRPRGAIGDQRLVLLHDVARRQF